MVFKNKSLLFFLFLFLPLSIFCKDIKRGPLAIEETQSHKTTIIVYVAADNDLDYFARRNIEQMKKVGSNQNLTIAVQLDRYGAHEHTKRLLIEKNVIYQVNADDITAQQKLNSGNAQTLIDCCAWAIESFPADHYVLVLWNHGIGIVDFIKGKSTNASELFVFNPHNHMLELNRSIEFLHYLETKDTKRDPRGVCFSDTYGSYLTNEKLDYALNEIKKSSLKGKNFAIIGFDACLMAMVEVAELIAPYADYMVASEEVELGTGWPYDQVLKIFESQALTPEQFATHIVTKYADNYNAITKDFTMSAIDLKQIDPLIINTKKITNTLITMLHNECNLSVNRAIKASRSKKICTYFSEPSYIDLHHFYTNLLTTVSFMEVSEKYTHLCSELSLYLTEGLTLIEKAVITNKVGPTLENAKGLAIYFPSRHIDSSYKKTSFAQKTQWLDLLKLLI
ncbi:hypothetical protein K9K77_01385 [Candidatus Babeliales bacterium]|nr:hypothetical protein [Candidatus Babeliales bacterium]